eukprot:SAG31_NODE_46010_length_256_cov_0.662420_1_plen_58_part_10
MVDELEERCGWFEKTRGVPDGELVLRRLVNASRAKANLTRLRERVDSIDERIKKLGDD